MFTLLALLFVVLETQFFPGGFQQVPSTSLALVGAATFLFYGIWNGVSMLSIQKVGKDFTSHALEAQRRDPVIRFGNKVFLAWVFITWGLLFYSSSPSPIVLMACFIFFGFVLDVALIYTKQKWELLNPFGYVQHLVKNGKSFLKKKALPEFMRCSDDLTEMALKAISKTSLALSEASVKGLETLACDYLTLSKTPSKEFANEEGEDIYVLSALLQRFQLIHFKAVEAHFGPLSTQLMVALGKIAFFTSKKSKGIANLPLHFLGEFARYAQKKGLSEASIKAMLTLQEVARNLLEDPQVMQLPLKEVFIPLIAQLEKLSKESFKRDKSISVSLLIQPFQDLKAELQTERMAAHPDTPWILQDIDRVMGEFEALEMILKTIPNIPGFSENPTV
jgi:hypothetical protein